MSKQLSANVISEYRIIGGNDYVLDASSTAAGEIHHADNEGKQRGDKDRGQTKSTAAYLLQILASGDESNVTHRTCLPLSE